MLRAGSQPWKEAERHVLDLPVDALPDLVRRADIGPDLDERDRAWLLELLTSGPPYSS